MSKNLRKPAPFVAGKDLVSPEQKASLSYSALRLYAWNWNFMDRRHVLEAIVSDSAAAKIAISPPSRLHLLQRELTHAGLLMIEPCPAPSTLPNEPYSRYTFVPDPISTETEAAQ